MSTHDGLRPRLLVLSHVLPFPRSAGQEQRVFYTLKAARELFHVTFATASSDGGARLQDELADYCDESIVLDSPFPSRGLSTIPYRAAGLAYMARTGLRFSNYMIGELNFGPAQIASLIADRTFDCALFEYWHAVGSVDVLQARGVPCVLDMHDILWRSRERQLQAAPLLPDWWRRNAVRRYQSREERSWAKFDAVVAINHAEYDYVRSRVAGVSLFHAPMGIDLDLWRYMWQPAQPPRLAFYGALATAHNQRDALECRNLIMPAIWERHPEAELWIVGSKPPEHIRALAIDPRVHVTGFVEEVQQLLGTMTAVLCPWSGTYGFRSRLIEVMGLGVPVVATPDAVYGMELENERGVCLGRSHADLAALALRLIDDPAFAQSQSRLAREQVERRFALDATYGALMRDLRTWLAERARPTHEAVTRLA